MTSYAQTQHKIHVLQQQAERLKAAAIDEVRKVVAEFGLTEPDIFGPRSKAAKPAGQAKYADGHGNSWSGMGKRPGWLREALDAGKQLEDFLTVRGAAGTGASRKKKPTAKAPRKAATKKARGTATAARGKKAATKAPKKAAARKAGGAKRGAKAAHAPAPAASD
jgi:DNA-binding protein H-NS